MIFIFSMGADVDILTAQWGNRSAWAGCLSPSTHIAVGLQLRPYLGIVPTVTSALTLSCSSFNLHMPTPRPVLSLLVSGASTEPWDFTLKSWGLRHLYPANSAGLVLPAAWFPEASLPVLYLCLCLPVQLDSWASLLLFQYRQPSPWDLVSTPPSAPQWTQLHLRKQLGSAQANQLLFQLLPAVAPMPSSQIRTSPIIYEKTLGITF